MNKSVIVAFSGIISAVGILLNCLAGIIPIATYALPGLAGLLLVSVVIELGAKWCIPVYFVTLVLSALLGPDKEAVLLYGLLLGYYPAFKAVIERNKSKIIQWIIKLLIFNVAVIISYFISINVLGVPADSYEIFPGMPWILLLAGNVVFVLYDLAITSFVCVYINRFHNMLCKYLKLNKK